MPTSLYGDNDEYDKGIATLLESAEGRKSLVWWRTLDPVERSAWRGRATCGLYGCAECRPSLAVNRAASVSDTIEWAYPRRLIEVVSCPS